MRIVSTEAGADNRGRDICLRVLAKEKKKKKKKYKLPSTIIVSLSLGLTSRFDQFLIEIVEV